MKNLIAIISLIALLSLKSVYAEEYSLSAGVSVNEIPKEFFGSWKVTGKLDNTNSYQTFKPQSFDIWTLSRNGDIVILKNPLSGASAEVSLKAVEGNLIIFTRQVKYDNKILTDTVSLRLQNGRFSGLNTLSLESYSYVDAHLMSIQNAKYLIEGEKYSGENILK